MKMFRAGVKNVDFVYFCAAYNDVLLAVTLVHRERKKKHLIVLIDVKYDISPFLESGFLIEVIELKNTNFNKYNPITILSGFLYSRYIFCKHFTHISNAKIYFFTEYYNVLLFSFLYRLQKIHEIILGLENYEDYTNQKCGILEKYFIRVIFGSPLNRYFYENNNNILGISGNSDFNYRLIDNTIRAEEISLILDLYSVTIIHDKSFLLFLESEIDYNDLNLQKSIHFLNFWKLMIEEHNCYVKSHPRFENSDFIKTFQLKVIEKHFPVEMINLVNCKAVIGFSSYALVNFANKGYKVISLIELFVYDNDTRKIELKNYLEKFSSNRILYPKTLSEFKLYLS